MNTLKTTILDTLTKNDTKMIPRWKFVLFSSLALAGIFFAFLVVIFVTSLILFLLSSYGFMYMPFFGLVHILHTLKAIPPVLFLCTVLLLIIIELVTRYYAFSFKRPLAVTLLMFTLFVTVMSFAVSQTGIHEYVRQYARDHHIHLMTSVYDRPLPLKPMNGMDVIRGVITDSSSTAITVRLFDGSYVIAYGSTTSHTPFVPLSIGKDVVVLGTFIDNHFEIKGVRLAPSVPFGYHMRDMRSDQMGGMEKTREER